MTKLPQWADIVLVPLISLVLAAIVSALVLLSIGQSPVEAISIMVDGAFGSANGWGYTLYYATSFMFTGLAVTVAFHAGLFNIGGEGQAQLGGLGVALVCLALPWPHWTLALLAASLGGAAFGAAWAAIPAYLQAKRGSHIVITTIMFNYIGAAFIIYMLVDVLRPPGQQDPATAKFPAGTHLPALSDIPMLRELFARWNADGTPKLTKAGIQMYSNVPANVTLFIAIAACFAVWALLWRTRLGYQIRAFGKSEAASRYAGINPVKITMIAMLISGGLAGADGDQQCGGGLGQIAAKLGRGCGLYRHRRGADGAQSPDWGVSGGDPVRLSLSRRRGPWPAHHDPAGNAAGGAGSGDPVYRSLGSNGADVAGMGLQPWQEKDSLMDYDTLMQILGSTVRLGTPLLLACLAGLFSERSGVFDIGLEGKMLAAAMAAATVAFMTGSAWIGLGAGIVALAAVLRPARACLDHLQRQSADFRRVALNFLASGLTVLIAQALFKQGGRTPALAGDARFNPIDLPFAEALKDLPLLGPLYAQVISGHSILVYAAFAAVPLSWWLLNRTRFGLRLRAAGENPAALDTAGVSVVRMRYAALFITGVLCGLAGAYMATALQAGFGREMTAGRGYIALAALIFAKWRALPALGATMLFGFFQALALRPDVVEAVIHVKISGSFLDALPYILTVIAVAGFIGKSIPPRAGGEPYVKER